jgi:hypothetical protein
MKKAILLVITLTVVFSVCSIAQMNGAPDQKQVIDQLPPSQPSYWQGIQATHGLTPEQPQVKFGPSAIWTASPEFLQSAHKACDNIYAYSGGKLPQCFIEQMTKAGAPADAVAFTRDLYSHTGQFGVMGAIKDYPPVALAWVVFPLRANNNDALLIVNCKPPFIDLDNMHELDKAALQKDPLFLQWKASAPQLDVWPAERSAGAPLVEYARVWPGPQPGDLQFVYSYPLLNGCATCAQNGFANYLWNFDRTGKFLGTKLLSVTRGAPPIKKSMQPPAPTDQPVPPAK